MDKFIAGAVAGMVTTTAMHPLEITKIRLQLGQVKSFKNGIFELIKNPAEAYRGLLPNFLGNTIAWGAYFYAYENIQKLAFGPYFGFVPSTTTYWVCSFLAGFVTQIVTNPIWVIKTQIIGTKKGDKNAVNSVSGAVKLILQRWGVQGFWRGFFPGLFGTVQSAVYFSMYSPMKPFLKEHFHLSDSATYFIASASGKCISTAMMYPYQPIRAEMQFRGLTWSQAVSRIYKDGWRAFYRGLSANLLRVVPAMVVTSMTYENIRKLLQ